MTFTDIWAPVGVWRNSCAMPPALAQGLYPKLYPPASEYGMSGYETTECSNPRFRPVNTARNDVVRRELIRPRGDC